MLEQYATSEIPRFNFRYDSASGWLTNAVFGYSLKLSTCHDGMKNMSHQKRSYEACWSTRWLCWRRFKRIYPIVGNSNSSLLWNFESEVKEEENFKLNLNLKPSIKQPMLAAPSTTHRIKIPNLFCSLMKNFMICVKAAWNKSRRFFWGLGISDDSEESPSQLWQCQSLEAYKTGYQPNIFECEHILLDVRRAAFWAQAHCWIVRWPLDKADFENRWYKLIGDNLSIFHNFQTFAKIGKYCLKWLRESLTKTLSLYLYASALNVMMVAHCWIVIEFYDSNSTIYYSWSCLIHFLFYFLQ